MAGRRKSRDPIGVGQGGGGDIETQAEVEHALRFALERLTAVPSEAEQRMSKFIEGGMSFPDAASAAGIAPETAFARSLVHAPMKRLFEAARGRQVLDLRFKHFEEDRFGNAVNGTTVKQDFLRKLLLAGLFDKIAVLAAVADPHTPLGARILMHFSDRVLPYLLPRETAINMTHEDKDDEESVEVLEKRFRDAQAKIAHLERERTIAERTRIALSKGQGPTGSAFDDYEPEPKKRG